MNASEKKNWWLFNMFSHSILTGTTCRMFQEGLKVFQVLVQCASRLNHSISLWVNSADHQSLIIAQEQQAVLEGLKKERDARRLQFPGCHTCFAGSFTAKGYSHSSGICTDCYWRNLGPMRPQPNWQHRRDHAGRSFTRSWRQTDMKYASAFIHLYIYIL